MESGSLAWKGCAKDKFWSQETEKSPLDLVLRALQTSVSTVLRDKQVGITGFQG